MKKFLASAVSAAMMAMPVTALAYDYEDVINWSMEPGATNVTAKTRMALRLSRIMDASTRMNSMSGTDARPESHNGRPDRRGLQSVTREENSSRGKKKHSTIKGFREKRAEMMKRLQTGGLSSSSSSSSSSESSTSSEASSSSSSSAQ